MCKVARLWPQVVLVLLCVVMGVSVDGIGVMGRERRERGGVIIVDGGGVGKSVELAVMRLCDLSYTAM